MSTTPEDPGAGPGAGTGGAVQVPAGDAGVGGPAEDTGDDATREEGSQTPAGWPEEVDPVRGPVADPVSGDLGDLKDPGAHSRE